MKKNNELKNYFLKNLQLPKGWNPFVSFRADNFHLIKSFISVKSIIYGFYSLLDNQIDI